MAFPGWPAGRAGDEHVKFTADPASARKGSCGGCDRHPAGGGVTDHAIRNLIRKRETYHVKSYIMTGQKNHEMRAMKASLEELLAAGEIDEALHARMLRNYA